MRSAVILCLVTLTIVKSNGTFVEFMSHINSRLGYAFTSAWGSVLDTLKQPVRYHRLGPSRYRVRARDHSFYTAIRSVSRTPSTSIEIATPLYRKPSFVTSTTTTHQRLYLPLIPKPKYRSMNQWRMSQIPRFAYNYRNQYSDPPEIMYPTITTTESPIDSDDFGSLSFV